MKFSVDEDMTREAEDFSDDLTQAAYNGSTPPAGWTQTDETNGDFSGKPDVLAAFTAASKHMQSTSFAKDLLDEWRDERADFKLDDPSFTMADFMDEMGYLENFTGRNLTQLVKYYLSPASIVDAGWQHFATLESNDGGRKAYVFCPMSFREHDGIMWFHDTVTGRGVAIQHDEL